MMAGCSSDRRGITDLAAAVRMALVVAHAMLASVVVGLDNGLGKTPLMGYGTWNDLGCNGVTADYVTKIADALVYHGLKSLGYTYLNVDDCWAVSRDTVSEELTPERRDFPNGMRAVAAYVHSRGLKFGLYTDRGVWTCGARPGSAGYETRDARTFAEWGVDYLKVDSCNAPDNPRDAITEYAKMRDALNATGRPVFLALCGWSPWYAEVGEALGNSWRVARDVNGICELWNTISINSVLGSYAGPGAWNDPDALISSTDGARVKMLPQQSRTQFSLWAVMAAPLILGADVEKLSSYDLETYRNEEVIAVNQDPLGKQGAILWENCPQRDVQRLDLEARKNRYLLPPSCQQAWGRPLRSGDWAVVLVNWGVHFSNLTLHLARDLQGIPGISGGAYVRNLWTHKDLGIHLDTLHSSISGNGGSEMFRLKPRHLYV